MTTKQLRQLDRLESRLRKLVKRWVRQRDTLLARNQKRASPWSEGFIDAIAGAAQELEAALKEK